MPRGILHLSKRKRDWGLLGSYFTTSVLRTIGRDGWYESKEAHRCAAMILMTNNSIKIII